MPPKKTKPNDASVLSCNHAGMPSNHGVLNTTTVTHDDPFSYPDVMTKNVLHADLLSQAMVNRVGVQTIKLP
jgi:hypothetical protein